MWTYFIRRVLAMIPMFFLMTGVFFALQNSLPGGPVEEALARVKGTDGAGGKEVTANDLTNLRKELERQYGLDKPVHERYLKWVSNVVKLDFGDSSVTRRPAIETVMERFPISLAFGIPGFFLTYLVAILLGLSKGLKDQSKFDTGSSVFLFVTYSIPPLVLSVLMLLVFCTDRILPGGALFPLGGVHSDGYENLTKWGQWKDFAHHLFLPVLCSLLGGFTFLTLMMKNSLLDVLGQDYIRTARAKGLSERAVVFRHALRNAILPLLVGIGGVFSVFLAGSITIESVFGLPGIGLLLLESISTRDYNVMMAVAVLQSIALMVGQLISDVAYVAVDPRIDFK
jgi:microcin C transport system permease protein